jgi:hypothetical protein
VVLFGVEAGDEKTDPWQAVRFYDWALERDCRGRGGRGIYRLSSLGDLLFESVSACMKQDKNEGKPSPRITHVSWGRMEVERLGNGSDFKLYPGGGREWDWNETGTHHVPGIQPADVQELINNGSRVVVLSRGMALALQTCPETLQLLREMGISYHVEETKAAVELYNRLAQTEAVGGLFHSTC